jgi:hypothetical protein
MAAPTESSRFWSTGGAGDGASTYTRDNLAESFRAAFLADATTQGVFNGLAVSGTSSPMTLATGSACVYGFFYHCTVAGDVTKATPSVGTTGFRVVLRAGWTAQTVRVAVVSSADGVSTIPAVTQSAGTTWEISLATGTITTGGVITLTDARTFVPSGPTAPATSVFGRAAATLGGVAAISTTTDNRVLARTATSVLDFVQINNQMIEDDAVVAGKIADGGVSATGELANDIVDDTKVGNRVPQFYRRQGGSATDWTSAGATTYTPTTVRMQAGQIGTEVGGNQTVTFPVAFSAKPLVFLQVNGAAGYTAIVSALSTTQLSFQVYNAAGSPAATSGVGWLAIGAE